MPKYVKGKDGKFAGSIGDGKNNVPMPAPATPTSKDTPQPFDALKDPSLYARFTKERDRQERALIVLRDTWDEEVTLTPGQLDDEAVYIFTNGHCHSFAAAAHRATGLPMVGLQPVVDPDADPEDLWDPNMKYVNHVALHLDPETYLDAEGVHRYEHAGNYEFVILEDEDELHSLIYDINVTEGEDVWAYPKPAIAETFVAPVFERHAPHLLKQRKR